jgi:hypothetical protein
MRQDDFASYSKTGKRRRVPVVRRDASNPDASHIPRKGSPAPTNGDLPGWEIPGGVPDPEPTAEAGFAPRGPGARERNKPRL